MEQGYFKRKKEHGIPGLAIHNAAIHAKYEEKNKHGNVKSKDSQNREYVQSKIREYISNGLNKSEIEKMILDDPIMSQFDYLEKQGISLEICINNWIELAERKYKKTFKQKDDDMIR